MQEGHAPLAGVVVIEMATFVAGPSAGMALAELGAQVVRIDPIGGAVDYNRWPVDDNGRSFYWSSLNRGKRSVALDLRTDAGRDLVIRMISAPGSHRGIVIDNAVGQAWLSSESLQKARPDLIHVHVEGHRDGRPAVDYTVNAEVGVPFITGPDGDSRPVNHVLPAWDLLTGMSAATAVLAALRRRDQTGAGASINIALADVALAGVANLGWLSEAQRATEDRARQGNHLYGSYGREFATSDDQYVMVVALTPRQWTGLVAVTSTGHEIAALETEQNVNFTADEASRYRFRNSIADIFEPWFEARDFATVAQELTAARVLWAPYRTLRQAARAMGGPLHLIEQPQIGSVITAESPIRWSDLDPVVNAASPLGSDTVATLAELADVGKYELSELAAAGVISQPVDDD